MVPDGKKEKALKSVLSGLTGGVCPGQMVVLWGCERGGIRREVVQGGRGLGGWMNGGKSIGAGVGAT